MKTFKNWAMCLLLAGLLCFAAGCGNNNDMDAQDNGTTTEEGTDATKENENTTEDSTDNGNGGNSVADDLGNAVEDVGDGVGDAVKDTGDAVEDAMDGGRDESTAKNNTDSSNNRVTEGTNP